MQDQAEISLLVLTPEYLRSDYCRHEMDRAVAGGAGLHEGKVLPVKRADCDLSAFERDSDSTLWVNLTNDADPNPWALLLKSLDAIHLNTTVPHWLDARNEIVRKLRDQKQSVNLVIQGQPNWRALRDHLRAEWLPHMVVVDLDAPAASTLEGLVSEILRACGYTVEVPSGARSVVALDALKSARRPQILALMHFENVRDRRKIYGSDLFKALRYLISEERKLVLFAESRMPARELLPGKGEDSSLAALLQVVELRQMKA